MALGFFITLILFVTGIGNTAMPDAGALCRQPGYADIQQVFQEHESFEPVRVVYCGDLPHVGCLPNGVLRGSYFTGSQMVLDEADGNEGDAQAAVPLVVIFYGAVQGQTIHACLKWASNEQERGRQVVYIFYHPGYVIDLLGLNSQLQYLRKNKSPVLILPTCKTSFLCNCFGHQLRNVLKHKTSDHRILFWNKKGHYEDTIIHYFYALHGISCNDFLAQAGQQRIEKK